MKSYNGIFDSLMTGIKTKKELELSNIELLKLKENGLIREIEKGIYEITPKGIEQRYANHIPRLD